jgi:proteasome lid subunit RPN8/RPN11
MNEDIQFGEVEEAAPKRALRPDGNRHFAVVAYGAAEERDLPIFVDLDVARDMEEHALSDTSVELGGVLLGGHYEDENGQPFVVVTDSLRAQHYESTKGSFKFTHDTWSAITREREQFPAELQMVGWYHTHPDWGVFLSGMDMFICDNFFNKKLDVAYVIDPCRGDRGMFQWTGDPRQRVRRTGGFFVTASRFRAAELEDYVGELSGAMPATTTRAASGSYPAPVVHLHQPRDTQPPWQPIAVLGMLALQFLLVAAIAWKTLTPPVSGGSGGEDRAAAAFEKLDKSLESRRLAELANERAKAKGEVLDQVVHELKAADDGFVTRLQERFDKTGKLTEDIAARDSQIREQRTLLEDTRSRLATLETTTKAEQDRLKTQNAGLISKNERLEANLQKSKSDLAALQAKLDPKAAAKDGAAADAGPVSVWWWVIGGSLAAIALVAGVWWVGRQKGGENIENPDTAQNSVG